MDPEITAMAEISKVLEPLDVDARGRVLRWAAERYGDEALQVPQGRRAADLGEEDDGEAAAEYESFPEFFDAANPHTGLDRLLVTAYWQQKVKGVDGLDAAKINRELKHLGHQSANITRDFNALMNRKPRLAIQVRKKGTTKQARKQYLLTREGLAAVERLLGTRAN